MRLSIALLGVILISAVVIGAMPPLVQDQDQEDIRGAFLTSRPKEKPAYTGTASKPPSRRKSKQTAGSTTTKTNSASTPVKTNAGSAGSNVTKPTAVNTQRIGIGLTIFKRDSNGLAIRIDPEQVFHKGDRVRILLETNTDGYLYIFNTTNDGPPTMIYPDPQLDEAGNYLQAHVPFEIPASTAEQERLRWLMFDENAGTEKLFFVFSREPLNGVPIEDDLITLCKESSAACPLKPSSEVWAGVQKERNEPLKMDRPQRYGRAQTESEQQAATRGLGLSKEDPPPSLIMMAASKGSTLVTTLDLIHK